MAAISPLNPLGIHSLFRSDFVKNQAMPPFGLPMEVDNPVAPNGLNADSSGSINTPGEFDYTNNGSFHRTITITGGVAIKIGPQIAGDVQLDNIKSSMDFLETPTEVWLFLLHSLLIFQFLLL